MKHFFPFKNNTSDALLILSVLIIASCGLAYELIAGALASYVLGDSVLQFSTVIGTYLFAMGIGSHLSQYVSERRLLQRFIDIELLVGLIGGLSGIALFLGFAWLPEFKALLYAVVLAIGLLVGMEIPLVMRILHARDQVFEQLISRVLTFDYLGALLVSLLFPLVFAPLLGLARSAVLFGIANVMVAAWTTWHFFPPAQARIRRRLLQRIGGVSLALVLAMIYADQLVQLSEQKRFNATIVYATSSPYQRLVVTKRHHYLQLFLNGNLQFSTRDEYRYHEALVHPVMQQQKNQLSAMHPRIRVLILGGGDGMAAREVLRYEAVSDITLVDLDKTMTNVFSHEPRFTALNQHALTHTKMTVINDDAYQWLEKRAGAQLFDVIIIDLPDPSQYSLAKLYSVSMYGLVKQHLTAAGQVVVQATSPYYAPQSFWSINKTLERAGFATTPYHAYVPSFGEWGFIVGQVAHVGAFVPPKHYDLSLRFLSPAVSATMFTFPPDMSAPAVLPNTLDKQPLVRYYQEDWRDE